MATCLIIGIIVAADGTPAPDVTVRATVRSTEDDQSGQFAAGAAVTSESVVAFTGLEGRFELHLEQGATMRLEIAAINLCKLISVPLSPGPVDFRALV